MYRWLDLETPLFYGGRSLTTTSCLCVLFIHDNPSKEELRVCTAAGFLCPHSERDGLEWRRPHILFVPSIFVLLLFLKEQRKNSLALSRLSSRGQTIPQGEQKWSLLPKASPQSHQEEPLPKSFCSWILPWFDIAHPSS